MPLNKLRFVLISSLLGLVAISGSELAQAQGGTSHKWNGTLLEATQPLSSANGYPNPGGTAVTPGMLRLGGFGTGALIDHVKVTGHPSSNVFTFKGTEVDYFNHGTQRSSFTGTDTIGSDGSQTIKDTGRFTGGTDRYRRATGHYSFTGTVPAGGSVISGQVTGAISY